MAARPGPFGSGPLLTPPRGGGPLDAAARYLGLSNAELFKQLGNGSSLADVANAQGKSVDRLEQALVDDNRRHLDDAVDDGDITKSQRARMLDVFASHVHQMVEGGMPPAPRVRAANGRGADLMPVPAPGFGFAVPAPRR